VVASNAEGGQMQTVALILAILFGALGTVAFLGSNFYVVLRLHRERRRGRSEQENHFVDRLYLLAGVSALTGIVLSVGLGSADAALVLALLIATGAVATLVVTAAFRLVRLVGRWTGHDKRV
jgi:hypothetical protein